MASYPSTGTSTPLSTMPFLEKDLEDGDEASSFLPAHSTPSSSATHSRTPSLLSANPMGAPVPAGWFNAASRRLAHRNFSRRALALAMLSLVALVTVVSSVGRTGEEDAIDQGWYHGVRNAFEQRWNTFGGRIPSASKADLKKLDLLKVINFETPQDTLYSQFKPGVRYATAMSYGGHGYGTNSPASTGLKIYAFGNDTWLDAYYPSYITAIPTNPKASPSESSRLPSSSSTTGSNSPSNPKAHQPDSSSSTSSSSSESSSGSNPDDSGSSSSPSGGNGSSWTSPGTPHSPTSDSNSSSSDGKDSAAGPSKSLVAGAVVGSLLGALAIAAIGVYGMRKRRRTSASDGQDRYGGGFMKGGRRLTGDEYGNYEEEYMGMVEKPRGGAAAGAGTSGGGMSALFSTAPARSASTGAANGVLPLKKRRRFDMLRDEEEDDEEDRHEPNAGGVEKGWARFDEEDEADDHRTRNRIASDVSDESTRIGVGIWGGMGLARSESVKSGTSYLGTNLGGFLRSDSTMSHEYGGVPGGVETVGDTSLTPIAEWEEDDDDEDDGTTESGYYALGGGGIGSRSTEMHNARSAESHQTRSTQSHTVQSHEEASIKTATRIVRPFSPGSTSSLYGSGFATPVPFTVQPGGGGGGITRSASASSSLFLSPIRRDNSSSWWSRLKQHQPSELPSSTAFEAIRDPAPAPSLDAQARAIVDPFSDHAQVPGSVERSNSLNEHGMMASRSVRGIHDRSISSNVSEVTATSSILEERMRGMDVVQRIRTGEGSDGSGSIGTGGGNSNQTTPELSQNPFSDPAPPLGSQTPGSVIFAGSQAAFSPRAGATTPPPVPAIPPFPLLPVILPPTPTRSAQSPPQSPRKARLMGPRPQPSQALPSIARSGSVKDLVREIERRNSLPLSTSPGVCSPFASPTKASRSKTTRVATGAPTSKVEHGLVKKPILYVANP
ncbi:hypothetical protein JCM11491_002630 [Sporobolomyces phaffii]